MRKFLSLIFLPALLLGSLQANAALINWQLNDVTFEDGSMASGAFTYDAAADLYSNWNISVTAGILTAYDYLPGVDGGFQGRHDATFVDFVAFPTRRGRFISLAFADALTDLGGTASLRTNGAGFQCGNCTPLTRITGGTVSANVPEPETIALFSFGLLGLALTRRKRTS